MSSQKTSETKPTPGPGDSRIVTGMLLMLFAGLCSSLLHIGVRYVSPSLPAIEIVALRSVFTLVFTLPVVLSLAVLLGMGGVAAAGNYCYVHALRIVEASLIMPADYVRLIWMAGWGFLFFAEVPLLSTWIGATLIIGSTLFITLREAQLAAERRRSAAKAD